VMSARVGVRLSNLLTQAQVGWSSSSSSLHGIDQANPVCCLMLKRREKMLQKNPSLAKHEGLVGAE
jgi:hypothetical protein